MLVLATFSAAVVDAVIKPSAVTSYAKFLRRRLLCWGELWGTVFGRYDDRGLQGSNRHGSQTFGVTTELSALVSSESFYQQIYGLSSIYPFYQPPDLAHVRVFLLRLKN